MLHQMPGSKAEELLEALAAAVVEADAADEGSLAAVREALKAARAGGALPSALAAVAESLLALLATPGKAAGALADLGRLLDGDRGVARPAAGRVERDAETVDLIGDFIEESTEALTRADELLLAIEKSGPDPAKVHALFRVFHTIKGVAGFLELTEIVMLSHATEGLLNLAREKQLDLDGEAFDVVFDATALLRRQLEDLRTAVEARVAVPVDPEVGALAARIDRAAGLAAGVGVGAPTTPAREFVVRKPDAAPAPVTPEGQAPARAPAPQEAQAPAPVATGEKIETPARKKEYVLRKPKAAPAQGTPPAAPGADAVARAEAERRSGEGDRRLGETDRRAGEEERRVGDPDRRLGEPGRQVAQKDVHAQIRDTVKVDLERVDSMVEMIGELIIVESMIIYSPEVTALGSLKLRNYLNQLNKISRDLQNVAMRMRMVPVRSAFQKMARLTRDLARKTGKDVVLEMSGEETEMDRSMVERIEEPLVHLVRNAIDHGVEPGAERKAAGKPARATLRLSAYHEGGSIVVELTDDGRGLQRDAILGRARAKGLVEAGVEPTDQEICNLLFLPGFSTAEEVTELSGRGVGMDVVKRNVEGMRGRVAIASTPGKGTTLRMVLPLTLAIIDGMLIACGSEKYIIPSLAIVESLRPTPEMLAVMAGKGEIINVRGEILPLLRLHRLLELQGEERPATDSHVVVVEGLGRKIGLVVDDVVSQQQVVIKPLGGGIGDTEYLSGAAILSDGRVGLILNVDRLSTLAARPRDRAAGPREAARLA
jgi:two-component system chemotaxis sensor kinase CheA